VVSILAVTFLIIADTTVDAQAAVNDATGATYSVAENTPSPSPGPSPSAPSTSNDDSDRNAGNGKVMAPLHEGSVRIVPGWIALTVIFGLFGGVLGGLIVWWYDGKRGKKKRE
jgi:hypothetical protein